MMGTFWTISVSDYLTQNYSSGTSDHCTLRCELQRASFIFLFERFLEPLGNVEALIVSYIRFTFM